jgi:hypothetical protein
MTGITWPGETLLPVTVSRISPEIEAQFSNLIDPVETPEVIGRTRVTLFAVTGVEITTVVRDGTITGVFVVGGSPTVGPVDSTLEGEAESVGTEPAEVGELAQPPKKAQPSTS